MMSGFYPLLITVFNSLKTFSRSIFKPSSYLVVESWMVGFETENIICPFITICSATAVCVPIASMVMMHPVISSKFSKAGIALISLLLESTLTCPNINLFSLAQALTICKDDCFFLRLPCNHPPLEFPQPIYQLPSIHTIPLRGELWRTIGGICVGLYQKGRTSRGFKYTRNR